MTVKPQYGFGKNGNIDKGIGPNKMLIYEIKMVAFEKAKESWQLDADAKLEQVQQITISVSNVTLQSVSHRLEYSKTKELNISRIVNLRLQPLDIRES